MVHYSPFYIPLESRPTTLAVYVPFSQDTERLIRHNSQGFRNAEYTTAHPPDSYRIAILGNALTWGPGVPMEDTYPQFMMRLLNEKCPELRSEVINLGTGGHRFIDNVIKFFVHAKDLNPDLIIFQVHFNDIDFYRYPAIYDIQSVSDIYAAYTLKQQEIFNRNSLDWAVFREGLEKLATWTKENSAPIVFVIIPPIDGSRKGANFQHYDPAVISDVPSFSYSEMVAKQIQEAGFPTLDLIEDLRREAGSEYLAVSPISNNLNSHGHRLVAHAVATFIQKNNFWKCERRSRPADPQWQEESILRKQAAEQWNRFEENLPARIEFFEKLKKLHPANPWIVSQLADSYFLAGRNHDAMSSYRSLTQLARDYAAPWFQIALCSGRSSRSLDMMRWMLETVPDHQGVMSSLASTYLKNENLSQACQLLLRLTEIPGNQQQYQESKELFQSNGCRQILAKTTQKSKMP